MKPNRNNFLIHKIARGDGGRYNINHVRVEPGRTLATCGNVLAIVTGLRDAPSLKTRNPTLALPT